MHDLEASARALKPGVVAVMAQLLEQYGNAKEAGELVWNSALPVKSVLGKECTAKDVAELVNKGFMESATVKALGARHGARFKAGRRRAGVKLVALTPNGARLARHTFRRVTAAQAPTSGGPKEHGEIPYYDSESRKLWLGDVLVKELERKAPEQEKVLEAFQEMHWEQLLDDPLTGKSGRDQRKHLEQTVGNLNRGMINPSIHFFVSGNRTQIGWKRARR